MANEWIATSQQLPKDGEVVHTKIDDEKGCRNEQLLKRQGNLWFFPDGSMYVYYRPTHWMPPRDSSYRRCLICGDDFSPITSDADNRYNFCTSVCEEGDSDD